MLILYKPVEASAVGSPQDDVLADAPPGYGHGTGVSAPM